MTKTKKTETKKTETKKTETKKTKSRKPESKKTETKKAETKVGRPLAKRHGDDDRRQIDVPIAVECRVSRRRKVQRRRQIDPTTCERDYTDPEIEFMQAMDAYKRSSGRMFPTCSEILEVIRDLGYRKVGGVTEAETEPEPETTSSEEE